LRGTAGHPEIVEKEEDVENKEGLVGLFAIFQSKDDEKEAG
jgi:hypothetical protein